MPDRELPSGADARFIARRYYEARERYGTTQREFAQTTGLSSARYLRKILAGERSGKVLRSRAERGGAYNVEVRDKRGNVRSFNVRVPAGSSRFDVYRPSVRRRLRSVAAEQAAAMSKRYEERVHVPRRFAFKYVRKPNPRASVATVAW